MSKPLAASKKLMQNYLSELLTEEDIAEVKSTENRISEKPLAAKKLEKLLNKVNVAEQEPALSRKAKPAELKKSIPSTPTAKPKVKSPQQVDKVLQTRKSQAETVPKKASEFRKGSFQALFFDVAGLIIAVPLIELGGIHNVGSTNSLVGKPNWFKGVMLHRDEKVNVVDTALWVMPEKCDSKLMDSLEYKYIIMLGDSHWGLMAENLVDTVTLEQEDVKWLDAPSKRPWLAGLVKDRMCALLEVDAFVKLLNDGFNINQG